MTIEMKFFHDDDLANLFYRAAEYVDAIFYRQLNEISDVSVEKEDDGWHIYITFTI